jgi:hypothetical protein
MESLVRSAEGSSREVVRRAVIQSTFRDLRTGGRDDIYLVKDDRTESRRRLWNFSTVGELKPRLRALIKDGSVLKTDAIERGDILELEVVLEADGTYKLVSALASIFEIVEGREAMFGIPSSTFETALPLVEVVNRLLVGLVPIRGVSTKFKLIEIDGIDYIVDRKILQDGSQILAESRPFEIVGVTEFKSYWRDLRRVLFTDSAYTAYVRVESGLRVDWNPVKLADVLRSIGLDIEHIIKTLPDSFTAASGPTPIFDENLFHGPSENFEAFGRQLASTNNIDLPDEVLLPAVERAVGHLTGNATFDRRREAFDLIVEAVEGRAGFELDREAIRELRALNVLQSDSAAGKGSSSTTDELGAREDPQRRTDENQSKNKLEVEFVAIYW